MGVKTNKGENLMFAQVHVNLIDHTKTRRMCKSLDLNPREVIGLLTCLWIYTLKESPDGILTDRTDDDVAMALFWDGDPEELVCSLIKSGFVERENGSLIIRDWFEHTGSAMTLRARNRERQKRYRDKRKDSSVSPLRDALSRSEQEQETEQETEQEQVISKKPKQKKKITLEEIASLKLVSWKEKYGKILDGENGRPTIEETLESAWDHSARNKYKNMPRYLDNWLKRSCDMWRRNREQQDRRGHAPISSGGSSFGPWLDEGFATKSEWENSKKGEIQNESD